MLQETTLHGPFLWINCRLILLFVSFCFQDSPEAVILSGSNYQELKTDMLLIKYLVIEGAFKLGFNAATRIGQIKQSRPGVDT